jgi:hypothetical protein
MRKLLLVMYLTLFAACCAFAQCGGQERWAVKDGTDPSAGQVDLTNIQSVTLTQLVQIHAPNIPSDNTTRATPEETRVVRLQARLIQWKLETDSDYHLVLTDDTEQFTQGHGKPTGHSLIGEIPSPDCLPGSHEEFGAQSPFLDGITTARHQLEAAFPNADLSGGWNDAGGANVEVVGVQFFDRAHGQVSRAPNNLEIHPILSIKFLDNPQEMLAASLAGPAKGHGATAKAIRAAPPQGAQPLTIQDPNSGETATITEDRALVVASSEHAGSSGLLRAGRSSPDLGFPKTLTICWFSGGGPGSIQISIDGKNWFDAETTMGSGCKAVPPASFVKLTSAKGMYQVSY